MGAAYNYSVITTTLANTSFLSEAANFSKFSISEAEC